MAGVNNNLIPPVKGEIRNPKGKAKGTLNSKTRLIRLLTIMQDVENPITHEVEGFSVLEQMDIAQIQKALGGDSKAYEILLDRLEGKPINADPVGDDINIKFEVINRVPLPKKK